MANAKDRGFAEAPARYDAGGEQPMVGQFRRLGSAGPAYEIMSISKNNEVRIEIVASGESAIFPLTEIRADPLAETIP